ncbi:MAG: type II toxin-antitoxin system VapC family toxin [Pseudonocardiaceae bacterium]
MKCLIAADVLIGALDRNDAHHAQSRQWLTDWRGRQDAVAISAVNLTEVLVAPAADARTLMTAREAIAALEIEVQLPNEAIAIDAARLRGQHPISLPDAYCLATARHTKSTVASYDQKLLTAAAAEAIPTV